MSFDPPRWLRDLTRFLPLKSQFVLSGNVRDLQAIEVAPGTVTPQGFNQTAGDALRQAGYVHVFLYEPLTGFQVVGAPGSAPQTGEEVLQSLGLTVANGRAAASIDLLGVTLERLVHHAQEPIARCSARP